MERYVCIHAHFYQPPRENPWLEAVELQDSSYPYHDWNERVAYECYVPNGASRILDGQGRIAKIVNNYSRISFNFGPTLLSWLERNTPRAYEQIVEADRHSRELFSGHGSALAQPYNHVILPLANARDKYTQIVWGMQDFQHRFGRDPEGMWLPEAAVDLETLDLLASLGIKFTVLAPHQARRTRSRPWEEWRALEGAGIDPTRAYYCALPSGRTLSLFFYDGPTSRAVAFEKLLSNGETFARRLLSTFSDQRDWAQLAHIATDGETYGHHHPHGDMALAYALEYIETQDLARITNYGEYLEKYPPSQEVDVVERSSWSCMHGVTRWESHCGCNSGEHGAWNQHWRGPLRQALNWLRDELAPRFEAGARELLRDPWAARNDFVGLVMDRSPASANRFFLRHAARELDAEEQVRALKLLEIQRHLMLMYTSCGWFFDELSGLETVQVLQYAGRALQLAEELFGEPLEERFLERLQEAWSNIPSMGNGRHVYQHFVRPARLSLEGVGAHYAIRSLFQGYRGRSSVYCYRVDLQESRVLDSGKARLAIGRARITSRITRERMTVSFAVLHFGDHNLRAGVQAWQGEHVLRSLTEEAGQAFSAGDLPECLHVIDHYFQGATYSLKSLLRDEQRRIVTQIVNATLGEAEAMCRQVYEHHAPLLCFLSEMRMPLPAMLRSTAEFVLGSAVQRALSDQELNVDRIRALLETATRHHINLEAAGLDFALRQRLNALVDRWAMRPGDLELLETVEAIVSLARLLPFEVNLWNSQNVYYELLQGIPADAHTPARGASAALLDRFMALGERLGLALPAGAAPNRTLPPAAEPAPATVDGVAPRDTECVFVRSCRASRLAAPSSGA